MSKKCNCPPEGAPDWVMTYGDMMSLLLCFFIILVALSEIKKEDEYQVVVDEVKKAFGTLGGGGKLASQEDPQLTLMKRLEHLEILQNKTKNRSNTDDPGIEGKETQVTRIREGMLFTQGGRITFAPGSAELSEQAQTSLATVADLIRGFNNKVELRGHAATMEQFQSQQPNDLWELSFMRAKAAMDYLISDELNIRPDRIRLVANADREPLAKRVYTPAAQQPNRRVEILVMEALVEDFNQPEIQASN